MPVPLMFSGRRWAVSLASAATVLCTCVSARAATPQEEAFLKAWGAHVRTPKDHKAVIAACQSVMDKSTTLGEFLPVVKTLAAWHLLAGGMQADAVRVFESAVTSDKAARPVARFADTMARRWLTRIDHAQLEKALKAYHADHVEFPSSLAPILNQPAGTAPAKSDRFGAPWVYRTEAFSRLKGVTNQRYSLYSKSLGNRLTSLKSMTLDTYGGNKRATIISRKSSNPVSVEFETTTDSGTQRGVATESGLINGIRFLKLGSDGRFALMIDGDCDFWVVAMPRGAANE
ncbi:MAG TPA: hypothetical protein P5026_06770 [Kiritimatiellia bacterium]|nr:hypothetical protein [Kiritimatiellia bacterium]HRU70120.1 hypothetical protein [Kiritimatiellia bacterium]